MASRLRVSGHVQIFRTLKPGSLKMQAWVNVRSLLPAGQRNVRLGDAIVSRQFMPLKTPLAIALFLSL